MAYEVIFTDTEFKRRLLDVVNNYKTIYMYAAYGFQVTDKTIAAKAKQNCNDWYTPERIARLQRAANQTPPVWGFDCVNLIKALLWGWNGNTALEKGGSKYGSNTVPDTNANGMFNRCTGKSADFSTIQPLEAVWMDGHIGVYLGDGLAIECTPKWKNGVQITYLANIGKVSGYNGRTWTKHGKLPWIKYTGNVAADPKPEADKTEQAYKLGDRVLKRTSPLMEGADVEEMQQRLNALGHDCGKADGEFGKNTEKGVKAFQTAAKIEVDGKFGPASLAALVAAEAAKNAADTAYTVEKGDSLWTIAKKLLGSGARYREIVKLNGLKTTVLRIGQKLKVPKK